MVTPVVDALPTAPDRGDGGAQFDGDAAAWAAALAAWTTQVNVIGGFCGDSAIQATAAALAGDLPPLTGHALKYMRVNAGEAAAEFAMLPSAAVGVEGMAELATSADAINAVESSKIMTAYRTRQAIDAHPLSPRAFVNFDMNGGVPIIASSYGVSSVSQSSNGVYQVNWEGAFASAGYAVFCTMEGSADDTRSPNIRGIDASYVRVGNGSDNGKNPVCVVAFGDLA